MTTSIWDGEYADYLNAMVTYPYKIHTGRLVGVTKYISGPGGINTGTLVKYELESCFSKRGDKWVLLHSDGDESKTFVVADEFASIVLEPAQKNSECLQESQLDDDRTDNKGDSKEEEQVESEGRVDVTPDQVKAVFAAAMNRARNYT
ncbi:hypothetical protein I9W82_004162 [Candida metapsilosis]|uniref:Uncharacterized protein n=1 Tax=Candida metapsilosis TaxID=273372 RepID=A0A8H7ZEB8_9ASCO|nr:hypothetical protein I9W82_004162 [Candida metapsilosis]